MRIVFLASLFLATAAQADLPEIIADFQKAEVIILGEIHDNPAHHKIQAEITMALQPSALIFEMFTPPQAETINARHWEGGSIRALSEVFNWTQSGWPPFAHYADIVEAAPDAVVFGAAVPIHDVKDAMFEGAAVIFGKDAALFGLDQPLPTEQQTAREANQMQAHCDALPENLLAGMVEAQRLRDATLADAVLTALTEIGGPVIVITGNGHAREDWGLATYLRTFAPDISITSLGQFEEVPVGEQPFTHTYISPPYEREDPCLDLRG